MPASSWPNLGRNVPSYILVADFYYLRGDSQERERGGGGKHNMPPATPPLSTFQSSQPRGHRTPQLRELTFLLYLFLPSLYVLFPPNLFHVDFLKVSSRESVPWSQFPIVSSLESVPESLFLRVLFLRLSSRESVPQKSLLLKNILYLALSVTNTFVFCVREP